MTHPEDRKPEELPGYKRMISQAPKKGFEDSKGNKFKPVNLKKGKSFSKVKK